MESYRVNTDIDEKEAEKLWATLSSAIRQIFNSNEGTLSFEEVYRCAYHLVLHKFGNFLYKNVEQEISANLKSVCRTLKEVGDSLFLRTLVHDWSFYKIKMGMIEDILMYLDRNLAQKPNTISVKKLGRNLFHKHIIAESTIAPRLRNIVLREIQIDRDGKVANKQDLKKVLNILIEIGMNDRRVYQEEFETVFLSETAVYYEEEAAQNIKHLSSNKYLQRVEERMTQEKQRCRTYLDASTSEPLLKVLEVELVQRYYRDIITSDTGCRKMFETHAIADLSRMHSLMKNVEDGLKLASDEFLDFILVTGTRIVEEHKNERLAIKFVNRLLEAKDEFDEIAFISFKREKVFQKARGTGLQQILNKNPATPHYLALFLDDIMKARAKGRIEHLSIRSLEETFGKIISIFKYLNSRDIFENYYKQLLAKRLLAKKKNFSVDIAFEAEKIMIKMLKAEIGQDFTTKLEKMLSDLDRSSQEMREFRNSVEAHSNLEVEDFTVTVLTREMWPYYANSGNSPLPDGVYQNLQAVYSNWYTNKHDGRKLDWLMYLGHAEIEASFGGKEYKLVVTTYQMLVLQLFNEQGTELSYNSIAKATMIPDEELKRHLISLTARNYKVLAKKPPGKTISTQDIFYVNEDFSSKYDRVRIPLVSARNRASLRQKIEEVIPANVKEDRKQLTDAAIVRILKSRKVVSYNELMAETVKHLSSRFRPSPVDVKVRIESLIDRDFIERDEDDNRMFKYVV